MHVISIRRLREFWQVYAEAEVPLRAWHQIVEKAKWQNQNELKRVFPRADLVGKCTVFDIGGNKFRLVANFCFEYGRVYIRSVMTHAEYDRMHWREECLCKD